MVEQCGWPVYVMITKVVRLIACRDHDNVHGSKLNANVQNLFAMAET